MPPSELRKDARESLKGKWGKVICLLLASFLVNCALTFLINFILTFVKSFIKSNEIFTIIYNLSLLTVSLPLSFGLIICFIKLKRGENFHCFNFIKEGFSRLGKAYGIAWHTFIRLLLPIICACLIAVLLIYAIYITTSIINNNNFILLKSGIVICYITTMVYTFSRFLLYILAHYISYDNPEMSSKDCVKKSEKLMKGNRGNYFLLQLYFIVIIILLIIALIYMPALIPEVATISEGLTYVIIYFALFILTLITIFLYITPYMQVATVCFYDRIVKPEAKIVEEEVKIEE